MTWTRYGQALVRPLHFQPFLFYDSNTIHDCNDTFEMFSSRSALNIAILKLQRQKETKKTQKKTWWVFPLSIWSKPSHSTSVSGCWLPTTTLVCVCGSGPFYSVKSVQFHHSFTHNLISFSSDGVSPRTKVKYTPKKVENNPKYPYLLSLISNHSLFLRPTLLTYSLLSSFPRPCLVVHPLHLLHVTTYLFDNVILEVLPDLTMVAFRITHHTWKRLPVSMLTVVSQHRWQCTPQKSECATIHMQVHRRTETKRTRMNIAVDQRHPWYASEVFGFLLPAIPISS